MTRYLLSLAFFLTTANALAHPGSAHGVLHGFAHPFTGLDHLLAMLLVGVLAARRTGVGRLVLPASFLAGLALGALLGVAGVRLFGAEPMVAASIVAFGAALIVRLRLPAAAALVLLFAIFHGYVHIAELSAFALGILAGSAALHAIGLALGLVIASRRPGFQS